MNCWKKPRVKGQHRESLTLFHSFSVKLLCILWLDLISDALSDPVVFLSNLGLSMVDSFPETAAGNPTWCLLRFFSFKDITEVIGLFKE